MRRDMGVIVLAIRKAGGEMLFNPPPDTRIAAGDHLIVMGEAGWLAEAGEANADRGPRMKVLTAAQMREVDRLTIEAASPAAVLMESAGTRVVELLEREFAPLHDQRVVIFCGKGNNGGDGLVAAPAARDARVAAVAGGAGRRIRARPGG